MVAITDSEQAHAPDPPKTVRPKTDPPQTDPPQTDPPQADRPRRALTAVLVAGVVGAVALPVWRVGIGWAIAALAILGAVLVARSGRNGDQPGSGRDVDQPGSDRNGSDAGSIVDRVWRTAAGAAVVALVAVGAVRAAGWLVAICLIAAVPLASYALAGGRSWRGIAAVSLALVPATVRGMGWAAGAGAQVDQGTPRPARAGRALAGFTAGVLLLLVFGGLFRAADPAFAALVDGWARGISVATLVRATLGFALVAMCGSGAAYLASARCRAEPPDRPTQRRVLGLAEWAIPMAMLDALFGLFVWIQVTVLFAGDEYVLGPGGPDYAVYARGGFIQLAVVAGLTLCVVAALARWAGRSNPTELGLLRVLGGLLCVLTLVVVASALKRLGLYASAYGFNVPRLLGYAGVVWLGLVFALVIVAGVRLRATWLPRATVAAAVGVLLGLAAINPEALMARTHIDRLDRQYPLDHAFLASLSADAIDELAALGDRGGWCRDVDAGLVADLREPDPWYGWNLGREHARAVLAERASK